LLWRRFVEETISNIETACVFPSARPNLAGRIGEKLLDPPFGLPRGNTSLIQIDAL
jgi:hypothetical protein